MPKSKHGPFWRVEVLAVRWGRARLALVDALCKSLRETYDIAAITNDIYTKEDAEFLITPSSGALEPERIMGVETGGCPHTAIREDALGQSGRGGGDEPALLFPISTSS